MLWDTHTGFSHRILVATQLFRLGRVRRVDGKLLINDAIVTVTGTYYLHQLSINIAQRVHTYRTEGETHMSPL